MEKLTLKELAPYLPYRLQVQDIAYPSIFIMGVDTIELPYFQTEYYKPILRPLSDLRLEHAKNCQYHSLKRFLEVIKAQRIEVMFWDDLLNNHYDVFGLIEKGLAIDINTLKK